MTHDNSPGANLDAVSHTRSLDDCIGADMHTVPDSHGIEGECALVDLAGWAEDRTFPDQAVFAQREDDVVRVVRRGAAEVATKDRAWG